MGSARAVQAIWMPACWELTSLIQGLPLLGRDDLLFTNAPQTTYPGSGYMSEQGATTIWEAWEGCSSQIHSCLPRSRVGSTLASRASSRTPLAGF